MVVSIYIGFRHCGKKTISVIVYSTIKARQLNTTTVIYVLVVDLLDGGERKIIGEYVFLFPSASHAVRRSTIFWRISFEKSLSPILF